MDIVLTPTALILNLPPGYLCGIDLLSFTTSPRFLGIKGLPPGWHFLFTSATTGLSVRHGVWFRVEAPDSGPPDLAVKRWDPHKEELLEEKDKVELSRLEASLKSIWRERLTPYRQALPPASETVHNEEAQVTRRNDWIHLTDHIAPGLLTRMTNGEWNHWPFTSTSSAKRDMDRIPGLSEEVSATLPEKSLNFLPINLKETWRSGAVGRERTEAAKDRSWALGDIIRNHCTDAAETEIIGEMQVTFLMVLTLGNYSCLEQWKRLLNLVLTCQTAAKERSDLFARVLQVLRLQLQHCDDVEGGLFDLSDEGGSMLKQLLRTFRRGLDEVFDSQPSPVKDHFAELEAYLRTGHGWELGDSYVRSGLLELEDGERVEMDMNDLEDEDERGEYAPVVVDLESCDHSPSADPA
ncbi:MAG: hypothetical protein M1817_002880 [Caeruleum heppii]|nr:MAG: hypothetical protein M1817_002880 [Caeruleum heppii]